MERQRSGSKWPVPERFNTKLNDIELVHLLLKDGQPRHLHLCSKPSISIYIMIHWNVQTGWSANYEMFNTVLMIIAHQSSLLVIR
jgi:hypothetical protein